MGHFEAGDVSHTGHNFQEQVAHGCRIIQDACSRKVAGQEKELEKLRQESEELRRQSESLRDRNLALEAELAESRRRNELQIEENRGVLQQAHSLRHRMGKLGSMKAALQTAFAGFDKDGSGGPARNEYAN